MSRDVGWLGRLRPDPYIVLILGMVVLASLLPARGAAAPVVDVATKIAIGLVFFLHGARLSREAVIAGLTHWRLHLLVLSITFGLFPVLGVATAHLPAWLTPTSMAPGLIFLGCLPSTIQSSISFTAIARGDVAAAVASASASNLIGIVVTPLLVALTMNAEGGGVSAQAAQAIVVQLLLPFVAGQLLRRWIGGWVLRHGKLLSYMDRGSILLVVYGAFSHAVVGGLWSKVDAGDLGRLIVICAVLLAIVLTVTTFASRALGFTKPDEIAIVFCGSKKGLATGVPMASVLFAPATAGLIVLPVMVFHQIQLMVCAWLARRYAAREPGDEISDP